MTTARNAGDPWAVRHFQVAHFKPLFDYSHLPQHLQAISMGFHGLALQLLGELNDGDELQVALRKLLEAKDAAVRQRVIDQQAAQGA